ncbi:type III restriction protein res subunit [Methanofollis liminatans DSM 4140]|uniref:Type III restriction protein res subunit n=1 Tax=Methanofollis liminatans DSM 4140 TaxID=28892 RepID=J0S0B0_9EURY|nr:HEAT repeat domain-containing protein [Methanofollis liminatans]EJG07281.1 type III restriction protein res subunit [Methanofollis liminatans DSM 4140]
MKHLSAFELEYLEHPERFTFDYFREQSLNPHPLPVALSLADEELLNHYDNEYHHRTFHRTLFFPRLDTTGPAYQLLEDYVAETSTAVLSERFTEGSDADYAWGEFSGFRKHLVTALHTYPEIQKVQILKKIAVKIALPPSPIDESARLFSVGSSLFAMEFYLGLKNAKKWGDYLGAWPPSDEGLREIAETPEVLLSLWKHQVQARDRWLGAGGKGVLEMATATGKTLIGLATAYHLFRVHRSLRVLVLCHSRAILNQWRREAIERLGFLGDPDEDYSVPVSYKGRFEISFNTLQMVMRDPGQYGTDLLIVDEVHHGAGPQFRNALSVPCKWKMGLSATVEGRGRTDVLDGYLGRTVYTYTLADARRDGIIPEFNLVVHKTFLDIMEEEEFASITESIRKLLNYINASQRERIRVLSRNRFERFESLSDFVRLMTDLRYRSVEIPDEWLQMIGLINKRRWVIHRSSPKLEEAIRLARDLAGARKCVLFAMDIATCERVYERLSGAVPAFIVHSKMKDPEVKHALQAFRAARNGVLIAPRMLDEGIDIPDAEVGINVASSKTKLQLIQRLGRILRNRPGKRPVFHHFVAVPRNYIVSEDSFTYQNDLAWITDVALKMGIPITEEVSADAGVFSAFERESEEAVRAYYAGHEGLATDDFGVIKVRNIVESILPEARARLVGLLEGMTGPLTDEGWARVLRSAYRNEQMVEVPSQRWLLVIGGREPAAIRGLILWYGGVAVEERKESVPASPPPRELPAQWEMPKSMGQSRVERFISILIDDQAPQKEQNRALDLLVREKHSAVKPLIAVLKDGNKRVREHSIIALGQIGSREAIPFIRPFLQDQEPGVRQQAALALGYLNDTGSKRALMKLKGDYAKGVKIAAKNALKMLEGI